LENLNTSNISASDRGEYRLKIITDEPTLEDALDFRNYSRRLAEIITNSTPRFSIGVFGGWGTGKTSLMSMTRQILDDNDKIITVWFDAWRYERENYLAVIPFLRTVNLTLDAAQKSKAGNWENVKSSIEKAAKVFSTAITITPLPGLSFDFEKARDALKQDELIAGERVIYYHITDFLGKALDELREKDKEYRIVIFIDDLDRCSPDKALEVLESVKSFFDVEGIVYVIGMDSKTINSLVRKKYGEGSAVEGLDYLQKMVQLPFQIPTWREIDITKAISKIISKGLEGSSELAKEFENHKELIVKAVQLNPREVKRFINNIIFAKAVFGKPLNELIVVQALKFRSDWNRFLNLITPDSMRMNFLVEYKKLEGEGLSINTKEDLDNLVSNEKIKTSRFASKDTIAIYQELVKENNLSLRNFLDAGAIEIISSIQKMEGHIRALETTRPIEKEEGKPSEISSDLLLLKILQDGNIIEFNERRHMAHSVRIDFSDARLSNANLSNANLSNANLSNANLSHANLVHTDLVHANLSNANLSNVDFSNANLLYSNLTGANLSSSRLFDIYHFDGMKCQDSDLQGAKINNQNLVKYFERFGARHVPTVVKPTKKNRKRN